MNKMRNTLTIVATTAVCFYCHAKGGNNNLTEDHVGEYKAVDLGLPSGTKWANMNIGAISPEDHGLYFAWGETTGYTSDTKDGRSFDWKSYKWMTEGQASAEKINKYQMADRDFDSCWYDDNGYFIGDGKSTIEPSDDAASVWWGDQWATPTIKEIRELIEHTTSELASVNNTNGIKLTSKINGNSIFLPVTGYRHQTTLRFPTTEGMYWSSSIFSMRGHSSSYNATILSFGSRDSYVSTHISYLRCWGTCIRPVLRSKTK